MSLWEKGDISNFLKEGRALQKSLVTYQPSDRDATDDALTARRFSKMMMEGRVRVALKLLSDHAHTGLLRLDETIDTSGKTVRDVLEDKHPDPKPVHPEALLSDMVDDSFHPAVFDNIIAEFIQAAALHTQDAV